MSDTKELDVIRKSLEAAVNEKSREKIIVGLAELLTLMDEPRYGFRDEAFEIEETVTEDLFELKICKDMGEVDALFKEVDALKKKIQKLPKPTKEEKEYKKLQTAAEELEAKGLEPERAREVAAERLMEKRGFKKCIVCGEWIDTKHGIGRMALVISNGLSYHRHCLEEKEIEAEEILAGIPMMREGEEINCAYCNEPIMARDPFKWECPEGESFMSSALCKYYHAFPKEHPLGCWWKHRKELKENKGNK